MFKFLCYAILPVETTRSRWYRALFALSLGMIAAITWLWVFLEPVEPVVAYSTSEGVGKDGTIELSSMINSGEGVVEIVDGTTLLTPRLARLSQVTPASFTEVWFDELTERTSSIAWGDMDGDGDLDLAVGNNNNSGSFIGVNRVYRNDGDGIFTELVGALGSYMEWTYSIAWGDMDEDGDLDLAVGNSFYVNRIYRNDGNGVFTEMVGVLGPYEESTNSVAWGDIDGDTDLDLIVGNGYNEMNRLYRNDGSGVFIELTDAPGETLDHTLSLAWGDMDGDGDLDLAIGNYNGVNRIYENNGSGAFSELVGALGAAIDDTFSLVWGDIDMDGDLDLVIGNSTQVNRIFQNNGNGAFIELVNALGTATENTTSVTLGDLEGDGDLDIAVGNDSQVNRMYRNDGTGVFSDIPGALGAATNSTNDITWGDMDGDGDLDLAFANWGVNRIFQNNGSGIFIEQAGALGMRQDDTQIVVLGDMDGDGDLDLAVGNDGENRLYKNDGQGNFTELSETLGWYNTYSLAWGDIDNDGDLDLAVGNIGLNRLYQNDGSGVFSELVGALGSVTDGTLDIAWGDMDSDGDLDLVAGNFNGVNRIYQNNGNGVFSELVDALGPSADSTYSVAWGDMDGDGDLDLVVGNSGQVNRLYENHGSGNFTELVGALGTINDYTYAVAWGDMDSDGDLDLAVGNGAVNRLYKNNGSGDFIEIVGALGTHSEATGDLAWGDVDGDGDLDLVVGTGRFRPNRLYQNNGSGVFTEQVNALGTLTDNTIDIDLGDIDGDGDLDLVAGNWGGGIGEVNRIYYNGLYRPSGLVNNGALIATTRPIISANANFYSSPAIVGTSVITVPYTVFDPEGNMAGHLSGYYSPTGGGYWLPAVATSTTITSHLSGASFDDFDPAPNGSQWASVSGGTATNSVCGGSTGKALNFNSSGTRSATTIPVDVSYGGTIYFSLKMGDLNNSTYCEMVDAGEEILFEYSTNNGASWTTITSYAGGNYSGFTPVAVPIPNAARTTNTQFRWWQANHSGTGFDNWAIDNVAFPQYYYWDTLASGFFGQSDNVVLRFEVFEQPGTATTPGTYQYTNSTPGSFQHPYTSYTTYPFRVRGTQVRVFTDTVSVGNELPGAIVYRLPAGEQGDAQPMGNSSNGQLWHTDGNGYLQGQGELGLGDQIMALYPITATQNYTIYYTSAPVTITGTQMFEVEHPGVQNLVVSPDNVLILYNLVVSLEWDARQDLTYMSQLESDFRRTSEILYDWTNGQVALGNIHIYHDRGYWGHANLVIQANNSQRPSAVLGGIVLTPTHDIGVTGVITNAYLPGQVRMPPAWNRFGDPGGTLGEDWPRTLAHELGHYLLFMPDNYLGLTPEGYLTFTDCFGSAMTDPYDESYSEFLRPSEWVGECLNTIAEQYLGRADWETISQQYPMLSGNNLNTGPGTLSLAVTQIQTFAPITPTTSLGAPFFQLKDASGTTIGIPAGRAQAYLIKTRGNSDPNDDYVIYLGAPVGSLVQARGAAPGDRLCVIDYSREPLRYGCVNPIGNTATPLTLLEVPNWEPQIIVSGVSTTTVAITVTNVTAGNLMVQLLPALGSASDEVTMNPVGGGTFTQTVTAPDGAYYGTIRIWVPGSNPLQEMFLSYAIIDDWGGQAYVWGGQAYVWGDPGNAWGGQAYVWGGQAWVWGGQAYVWGAPLMSTDGQVSIFPLDNLLGNDRNFAIQNVVIPPELPDWLTPVGQAYRLQASENMPQSGILFQYVARDVPLGYESGLHIYYSPDEGQTWQQLPTELDVLHNDASAAVPGAGIFVLISTIEMPPFSQGWNNFGYPVQETRTITEALASIAGFYTSVYEYVPTQTTLWQLYDDTVLSAFTPLVNTLDTLQFGHAYWITVTQPITLYLGVPTNPLVPANNNLFPPATYYGWITPTTGFNPTPGMTVRAEVNGVVCGETQIQAWNGQLAYVIQVQAESLQGPPTGCGATGRTVLFRVDSWVMDHTVTWSNSQAWYHPLSQFVVPISGLTASNDGPTALGNPTTLTASVTAGSYVVYAWSFGDGNSGQGAITTHTYSNPGTYTAIVTATNPLNTLTTATTITVEAAIAGLQANHDGPTVLGASTNFTATITAGSNVSYDWTFGDGTTGTGTTVNHTYAASGNYTVIVTATNLVSSQVATTTVAVEVEITNLTATNNGPTTLGTATIFTATVGTGNYVSYDWSFGDGETGTGAIVSHTYANVGLYTVIVTATNQVSSQVTTTVVLVEEGISGLTITTDGPTVLGTATTFTATVITGSNVSYQWSFGDGAMGEGSTVSHNYLQSGIYTATVTASNAVSSFSESTVVMVRAVVFLPLLLNGTSSTTAAAILATSSLPTLGSILPAVLVPLMVLGLPYHRKRRQR